MPKYSAKYIAPGNSAPAGWVKYGNIAIDIDGIANASAQPFTPGIDESLDATRYVIITDSTNAGLAGRKIAGGPATASADIPTFWVSSAKTDDSFCQLVNRLPGRQGLVSLTSSSDAFTWLISNGYWSSFTQSIPAIVTNGLVLNLDAGKTASYTSGNTWYDISGNNINASLTNGPVFNSSNGGSFILDGVDDYFSTNYYGYHNTFTIVAWVKPTSNLGADTGFIFNRNSYWANETNSWPTSLTISNDGSLAALTINNGTCYNLSCGAQVSGSLTVNTWNCVIATRSTGDIKIYVNGVLKQSTVFSGLISNRVDTPWTIGKASIDRSGGYGKSYYKGNIGNIMFYNRDLSDTEVLQNFNATKSRFGL